MLIAPKIGQRTTPNHPEPKSIQMKVAASAARFHPKSKQCDANRDGRKLEHVGICVLVLGGRNLQEYWRKP